MGIVIRNARQLLVLCLLALVSISTIYPLFFVFNTALKTDAEFSAGHFSLAFPPSFDNFAYAPHYYDAGVFLTKSWSGSPLASRP